MPLADQEQTQFFYQLTPDKILDAVESIGFRCTGRCLALNSMENRVYEVEIELTFKEEQNPAKTPSDHFRVVKFYRPGRWTKEQILEEHQFLDDLVEADIPVIAPIKFRDQSLHKMPELEIYFTVFPKRGGRIPDEFSDEDVARVGRLLARVHSVGIQRQAKNRLKLNTQTYALDNLEFLLNSNLLPQELKSSFKTSVERVVQLSDPLFKDIKTQRIHGDCHLGNLLLGNQGLFLLDFDDMVVGPCVQDMWLIMPGRDHDALLQRELLIESYQTMCDFDRKSIALIEPLRTLRYIHYCAWVARRWEDPAFKRTFVNFGTARYWQDLMQDLREQISLIESQITTY